jgi:hypothetical protein
VSKLLIVTDFDGTAFDTFRPSPCGLGVVEAVEEAIRQVLGPVGVEIFHQIGGLKNRAPGELVRNILQHSELSCLRIARRFFEDNVTSLDDCVPAGKGWPLQWTDNCPPEEVVTELFVRTKLRLLLAQISTAWPLPMMGFADFWRKACADTRIGTAILSSGHEHFILRSLEAQSLPAPDSLVTDDDFRGGERLEKPDPRLFVHVRASLADGKQAHHHAVYIGDDPGKDGELARRAGVPFFHFGGDGCEGFSDWSDLSPRLECFL